LVVRSINIGKKMKVEIGIAPYTTNKRNDVLIVPNALCMVSMPIGYAIYTLL